MNYFTKMQKYKLTSIKHYQMKNLIKITKEMRFLMKKIEITDKNIFFYKFSVCVSGEGVTQNVIGSTSSLGSY